MSKDIVTASLTHDSIPNAPIQRERDTRRALKL